MLFCMYHNSNIGQAHEMSTSQLEKSSTYPSEEQESTWCQVGVSRRHESWRYESWSSGCEECSYRENNDVLMHVGEKNLYGRERISEKNTILPEPSAILRLLHYRIKKLTGEDSSLPDALQATMSPGHGFSSSGSDLLLCQLCISFLRILASNCKSFNLLLQN